MYADLLPLYRRCFASLDYIILKYNLLPQVLKANCLIIFDIKTEAKATDF